MDAPLPPIISDMISRLANDSLSPHERNNVASMLEIIGKNCIISAEKWREKYHKAEAASMNRRKSRKARA